MSIFLPHLFYLYRFWFIYSFLMTKAVCSFSRFLIEDSWHLRFKFFFKIKINLGICIAPTQPFRAALGAESRVCYPGITADRQTQWVLAYYHVSESTANQNEKLIHCHHWDSNSWSSGCWRTSLTTWPSPTRFEPRTGVTRSKGDYCV
jgi:hypothetical protein